MATIRYALALVLSVLAFAGLVAQGDGPTSYWKRSEVSDPMTDKQTIAYALRSDNLSERSALIVFSCANNKTKDVLLTADVPWFDQTILMGTYLMANGHYTTGYTRRVGQEKATKSNGMLRDPKTVDIKERKDLMRKWLDSGVLRLLSPLEAAVTFLNFSQRITQQRCYRSAVCSEVDRSFLWSFADTRSWHFAVASAKL